MATWLSGCNFSLAADVTPPPGYQAEPENTQPVEATSGPLFPVVPPDPAKGRAIYVEKCAPCHGQAGLGDGPRAGDLPNPIEPIGKRAVARQSSPAAWFKVVSQGNMEKFMPAFTSLTDRQRWDVVAYLYQFSTSVDSIIQGATLYQAYCVKCHGASGDGLGAQASAQMVDFNDQENMAGESAASLYQAISDGVQPGMSSFAGVLAEDERWALTDYIRSLTFGTAMVAHAAQATTLPAQATGVAETTSLTATASMTHTSSIGTALGQVTNGSGGSIPAGLAINLHVFDQMTLVYTATAQTEAGGAFRLEGAQVDETSLVKDWTFLATVNYQGVVYGSEMTTAGQDGAPVELLIPVYDTTEDSSTLAVDRWHFFFELLAADKLRVVELYVISNPTNKTIVAASAGQPVLNFTLPQQADNLQFQDGELGGRYVKTANGFGDTAAIQPGAGNYQLLFSYEMPYQRKLELTRPATMNTQAVVVLAPEGSLTVLGEGLQDGGMRDVQGVQYHLYDGGSMSAGSVLRLTVSGSPAGRPPALLPGQNSNLILGLAALGLALVVTGVWLYWRNRPARVVDEEPAPGKTAEAAKPPESPENLMDAILALDDLYKDGQLPEEAYLERRVELKRRLKESLPARE